MVLKELGGWETIEMVQKYAHLAPSHLAGHASTVKFWSRLGGRKKKCRWQERHSSLIFLGIFWWGVSDSTTRPTD